jgi:hypothetical protein
MSDEEEEDVDSLRAELFSLELTLFTRGEDYDTSSCARSDLTDFLKKHSYSQNQQLVQDLFRTIATVTDAGQPVAEQVVEFFGCDYFLERLMKTFIYWVEQKKDETIAELGLHCLANLVAHPDNQAMVRKMEEGECDDGWNPGYESCVLRPMMWALREFGEGNPRLVHWGLRLIEALTHTHGHRNVSARDYLREERLALLLGLIRKHRLTRE